MSSASRQPLVSFVSLGCPKNLVDSERLMDRLRRAGYRLSADPEGAQAVIVNTCGFIGPALAETADTLAGLLSGPAERRVYALGCAVSRPGADLAGRVPGLAGAFRLGEEDALLAALEREFGPVAAGPADEAGCGRSVSATPAHIAYLKISEGCDRRCSYCTIPSIRGPQRDGELEALVAEAEALAGRGARELLVVAQDTTAWGLERYGRRRLPELLARLGGVAGLSWIRLLYAGPDGLDDTLAEVLTSGGRILPYLDLPLQHASPAVLRRMNRQGSRERVDAFVGQLRARRLDFCLRTTLMTGFPGESEEEFLDMVAFVERMAFDRLGAFVYCRERGTPAARMRGQVEHGEAVARLETLMRVQRRLHRRANRALVGAEIAWMVDRPAAGRKPAAGRTWRDAPGMDAGISVRGAAGMAAGEVGNCRVTGVKGYDLEGER